MVPLSKWIAEPFFVINYYTEQAQYNISIFTSAHKPCGRRRHLL